MAAKQEKNATLVGFFVFLGMICLGLMIAQFSNIRGYFDGDYKVTVVFADASGLVKDGAVTRGGARIGRILGSPVMQPDGQVQIEMKIRGDVKIQEGSAFTIYSVSLLGDKAVAVKDPPIESSSFLKDGDRVIGQGGGGLDEITSEAQNIAKKLNGAVDDVRLLAVNLNTKIDKVDSAVDGFNLMTVELTKTLKTVNESVLDKESISSVKRTIANVEAATATIKDSVDDIKPLIAKAEPMILAAEETLASVKGATDVAQLTFAKANTQIDALKPAMEQIPDTLANLKAASSDAKVMMGKVGSIADEAKEVVAKVNNGDGLLSSLAEDAEMKTDAQDFVKNLKEFGILRYRDAPTAEKEDPKRDRFRGDRR